MSRNLVLILGLTTILFQSPSYGAEKKESKSVQVKKLTQEINYFLKKNNFSMALKANNQLLQIDSKNSFALKQSKLLTPLVFAEELKNGVTKEKKGDFEGARQAYTKALTIQNDETIKRKIDELNKKLTDQKEKESQEMYLKALETFQKGDPRKASILCEQALILNPKNIYAQKMSERLKYRLNHLQ